MKENENNNGVLSIATIKDDDIKEILSKVKKTDETQESLSKRVVMSSNLYKELQKIAIDLDIDDDGRLTPTSIGIALEAIYLSHKNFKLNISTINKRIEELEEKVNTILDNLKQ